MEKKIPQRMCIVCRKMYDKADLVRLQCVDQQISVDRTGKKNGRGAYVCMTGCASRLEKTKALDRAFKMKVEKTTYDEVLKEFDSVAR